MEKWLMIAGVQQESECERLADSENGPHLQANEEREKKSIILQTQRTSPANVALWEISSDKLP